MRDGFFNPFKGVACLLAMLMTLGGGGSGVNGEEHSEEGGGERVLFDFESGTFAGWKVEGTAFGEKPCAVAEARSWREDRRPFGMQGQFFVKTGETRHATTPDSKLTSDEFEITHHYLKFLLAGEVHPRVRVALLVNGKETRVAYGNNAYDLRLRGWDVKEFKGQKARLLIEEGANVDSLIRVDYFHLSNTPPPEIGRFDEARRQESDVARYGEFRLLYQLPEQGFIKRSSLVFGPDGDWHLFGAVADGKWEEPNRLFHARGKDLSRRFLTVTAEAMKADSKYGEQWIREPFVTLHQGTYYCYFVGSGIPWKGWDPTNDWKKGLYGAKSTQGPYGIHLATSKDGKTWARHSAKPLFTDAAYAFTPYVTRVTNQWVMYYAGNEPATIKGHHAIIARTSEDLIHWGDRRVVFIRTATDAWPEHSFTHSPTVIQRGDYWYLLCGPMGNNNASRFHFRHLYRSHDPFHWAPVLEYGPLKGLFLEGGHSVVRDERGGWFITHDGVYAGGVWLARLDWNDRLDNPPVTLPSGAVASRIN